MFPSEEFKSPSVINQGDEFMSFPFKMKLYLNSWRGIYVFFLFRTFLSYFNILPYGIFCGRVGDEGR